MQHARRSRPPEWGGNSQKKRSQGSEGPVAIRIWGAAGGRGIRAACGMRSQLIRLLQTIERVPRCDSAVNLEKQSARLSDGLLADRCLRIFEATVPFSQK